MNIYNRLNRIAWEFDIPLATYVEVKEKLYGKDNVYHEDADNDLLSKYKTKDVDFQNIEEIFKKYQKSLFIRKLECKSPEIAIEFNKLLYNYYKSFLANNTKGVKWELLEEGKERTIHYEDIFMLSKDYKERPIQDLLTVLFNINKRRLNALEPIYVLDDNGMNIDKSITIPELYSKYLNVNIINSTRAMIAMFLTKKEHLSSVVFKNVFDYLTKETSFLVNPDVFGTIRYLSYETRMDTDNQNLYLLNTNPEDNILRHKYIKFNTNFTDIIYGKYPLKDNELKKEVESIYEVLNESRTME